MRAPQRDLHLTDVVGMKVSGHDKRLLRCLHCRETPAGCNKDGCGGRHEPDWRRIKPDQT
jgi:hypothetical protein